MEPRSFPDQPLGGTNPPATVDNVRHLLKANGVVVRYNVIKKRTEIIVPWLTGLTENADGSAMTHVLSLAARCGMPTGLVPGIVEALGDENAYNPAALWMKSRPWDRLDRVSDMCATLTVGEGYPLELRNILVHKWFLSIAAAALKPDGFRTRGVLTLQGPQGIGKTSWGLSIIDDPVLRKTLIKVDHHLDAGNKDSLLGVIDHLIAEIGELESSLKRDVSRLKGFLTSGSDKIRRPYGRVTVEYQRRTVFYATVNSADFLVDTTGNTRWWTIPVVAIDFNHGIDMQQLFAQLAEELDAGGEWWLTAAEEALLEEQNSHHRSYSLVREQLMAVVDPDVEDTLEHPYVTATEALEAAGVEHPTNAQAKECATIMREWFGEPRRINGRIKWRVPFRSGHRPFLIEPEPLRLTKSKFD